MHPRTSTDATVVPAPRRRTGLGAARILVLATAGAAAVANLYVPQSVVPLVARDLGEPPERVAAIVTAAQVAYAVGIWLIVPLVDRLPSRRLLLAVFSGTTVALLVAAAAPSLVWLVVASAAVGTCTVGAQVIAPLVADAVAPHRRGAVLGLLLGASTLAMLVWRVAAADVGERFSWRATYLGAAVLSAAFGVAASRVAPRREPGAARASYAGLVRAPVVLLRREALLRRSAFLQGTVFAGYSAVWTCLALLLTTTHGLGVQAVGWFALVTASTGVGAPLAGRLIDRWGSDRVNDLCCAGVLGAAVVLLGGAWDGGAGIVAVVVGLLLLDVSMQCGMVANQARFFALPGELHGRLNTGYMVCAYSAGALGSLVGAVAYGHGSWPAVCLLLASLTAVAVVGRRLVR